MTEDQDYEEKLRDYQCNPNYENRGVAFYDFLGWRSKIAGASDDPEKIGQLRRMILLHTRSLGGIVQQASPGIRFSTFSDNVVVTCEAERDAVLQLIDALASFQLVSMAGGFLMRGGLTVGPIHHDNVSVFGPALNRAYELESEVADVPRIVVDDQVPNIVGRDNILINSTEDFCFLDPFTLDYLKRLTSLENRRGEKNIYDTLGLPPTGRLTVEAMTADQFFGTPLNALKPLIRGPLHDKEYKKIAWVYDRLAKLLGVPLAGSYPRVLPTD